MFSHNLSRTWLQNLKILSAEQLCQSTQPPKLDVSQGKKGGCLLFRSFAHLSLSSSASLSPCARSPSQSTSTRASYPKVHFQSKQKHQRKCFEPRSWFGIPTPFVPSGLFSSSESRRLSVTPHYVWWTSHVNHLIFSRLDFLQASNLHYYSHRSYVIYHQKRGLARNC